MKKMYMTISPFWPKLRFEAVYWDNSLYSRSLCLTVWFESHRSVWSHTPLEHSHTSGILVDYHCKWERTIIVTSTDSKSWERKKYNGVQKSIYDIQKLIKSGIMFFFFFFLDSKVFQKICKYVTLIKYARMIMWTLCMEDQIFHWSTR